MTSLASLRMLGGTVMPSACAVLRLITSSNLVAICTGSSAGRAPLRSGNWGVCASPSKSIVMRESCDAGTMFHVMAQLTGQPAVPIYARSNTEFSYKDAEISFITEPPGQTTSLILRKYGVNVLMKRIDAATAQQIPGQENSVAVL